MSIQKVTLSSVVNLNAYFLTSAIFCKICKKIIPFSYKKNIFPTLNSDSAAHCPARKKSYCTLSHRFLLLLFFTHRYTTDQRAPPGYLFILQHFVKFVKFIPFSCKNRIFPTQNDGSAAHCPAREKYPFSSFCLFTHRYTNDQQAPPPHPGFTHRYIVDQQAPPGQIHMYSRKAVDKAHAKLLQTDKQ